MLGATAVLSGLTGAKLAKKIKIPQVVGYIAVGVVLGSSFFNIIPLTVVNNLRPLNNLALAFIGFTIGGELAYDNLKELGGSIAVIALMESLAAFLLVLAAVFLLTRNLPLALIFGALASATAPAATVDVLWEYRAKGPLTTTLFAVVGIDDGVALVIYGFASSFAKTLISKKTMSIIAMLWQPALAVLGALVVGIVIGLALSYALKRAAGESDILLLTAGAILLASGIAVWQGFSLILTNMILGITLTNLSKRREGFSAIARISPPFYLLFFILVGASFQIGLVGKIGLIGLVYILFRAAGKSIGAWTGAFISKAPSVVRSYLGFGLLSQAGVAIGLAIETVQTFRPLGGAGAELAVLAINVIAGTTFIFQLIGPSLTKFAITRAGEVGKKAA